jgi:hypothetical protein
MDTIKINVLKTNINDIGYNPNIFASNIKQILPHYIDTDITNIAANLGEQIIHEQKFIKTSNDVITLMQLLDISYVIIDDTNNDVITKREELYTGSEIRIRAEKVIKGIHRNYPINVDLNIKKVANSQKYIFANLANLEKLLRDCKNIYWMQKFLPYLHSSQKFLHANIGNSMNTEILEKFHTGRKVFNVVNKYFLSTYNTPLNMKNINIFYEQIISAKLLESISCTDSEKSINTIILKLRNEKLYDGINVDLIKMRYARLNEFNYLLSLLNKEQEYYKTILAKIAEFNIKSVVNLRSILSESEFKKIANLLAKKIECKNNCAHIQECKQLYLLLEKSFRGIKDKIAEQFIILREYLEKDGRKYICKKCKEFIVCQHSIDGLELDYDAKQRLLESYKSNTDEGIVFCKECNEKLYRIYKTDILDTNAFNILVRARTLDQEKTNELPVLRDLCRISLKHLLSNFIFHAEVSKNHIIKELLAIIAPNVNIQLHKLKLLFNTYEYIEHAKMIAFIFGYVFLMETFMKDANMTLRDVDKNQKDYLNYFGGLTYAKFQEILGNKSQIRNFMIVAYEETKIIDKLKNNYVTKFDHVNSIINSPIYGFLYELYCLENLQSSEKALNEIEVFNSIIFVKDARAENFYYDAYIPKSEFWRGNLLRDIYEYLYDFSSKNCIIHKLHEDEILPDNLPKYVRQEFSPTLQNKLCEYYNGIRKTFLAKNYKQKYLLHFNIKDIMAKMLPINYLVDEKGNFRNWVVNENKAITCDKLKLSDKMPLAANISKLKDKKPISVKSMHEKHLRKHEENLIANKNRFNVILKIDKKYDIAKIEYIGNSGGVYYHDFLKGNIIDSPNKINRVYEYILIIVKNYNRLKFRPSFYKEYFHDRKDLLAKYTQDKFPDIASKDFLREYSKIKSHWSVDNLYVFLQNYLLTIIENLTAKNDEILKNFLLRNLDYIFSLDQIYSKSKSKNLLNLDVQDNDILAIDEGEVKISKNDKGFVNLNEIDYEQDEDDIPISD